MITLTGGIPMNEKVWIYSCHCQVWSRCQCLTWQKSGISAQRLSLFSFSPHGQPVHQRQVHLLKWQIKTKTLYFPVNEKGKLLKFSYHKWVIEKKYEEIQTIFYLYFIFLSILPIMTANAFLELGREYSRILNLTYTAVLFFPTSATASNDSFCS